MGGLFSPKMPNTGPTQAQLAAQASQETTVKAEEARLAAQDAADAAAKRARLGRNAGRALLLDDETGVQDPAAGLAKTLGS